MTQSGHIEKSSENPYIFGRPLKMSDPFYGRQNEISWLKKSVWEDRKRQPLTIFGSPAIGKTSIVNRLVHEPESQNLITIIVDTPQLSDGDVRDFLWRLSQRITQGLTQRGRIAPSLQKRMLVLRPLQVFSKKFWLPLAESLGDERLLIAFDDTDVLFDNLDRNSPRSKILDIMTRLYEEVEPIEYLLVLSDLINRKPSQGNSFVEGTRALEVSNFSIGQSLDIIRQSYPYRVADIVGRYIHNLTGGHPNDLQRLCYALYDRCLHLGITHITMADVTVTLTMDLTPADFHMPVFKRRNIYKHRIPDEHP